MLALAALGMALSPPPPAPGLVNASFDDGVLDESRAPRGWAVAVYGALPDVGFDEPPPGLAGYSLRVESQEDSDTAIYQDLRVAPGAWFRLSAWIRTADLVASTPIYGAICACDGPMPYARSRNLGGTSEWQRAEVLLRSPSSGVLRVALFYVGFGKGTGTVWFDEVELTPVTASEIAPARIAVTDELRRPERISPFIYGNFVEFLDNHVQGMRAQMLHDVSFEGILPPADWCHWQADKDVEDHPWHATGDEAAGAVTLVEGDALNGARFCRLAMERKSGGRCGIRQGGLAVLQGRRYTLAAFLRADGLEGPVTVSLGRDYGPFVASYASADIDVISSEWKRYAVELVPDTTDHDAELSIRAAGTGVLDIDQVTLMPEGHLRGWRSDVVDAVRRLKPNCIRFGGSAVIAYDWKSGIGDPDRRAPFQNVYWGRMEPNDVGIDEFLQFCELVGAEPLVCVSYNVGGPEDAAAQVEYCNGPPNTRWGSLRARNGHPEPYRVRLWQVGNEQSGDVYERSFTAYCQAMRAADPTIEIAASSSSDGIVEQGAAVIDYVSPHYYTPSLLAIRDDIDLQRRRVERLARGRRIRLAITEWNQTAGDWGGPRALMGTLGNALYCARVLHIYQRNCDIVAIANRSNMTNSWWAGVIQTDKSSLFVTPAYHVLQLFSTRCGSSPLRVTDGQGLELLGAEQDGPLDVMATRSDDGSALTVTVVNDGPSEVASILDLSAHLRHPVEADLVTLAGDGPMAINDWARPELVAPQEGRVLLRPRTRLVFPAWSLTVVVLRLLG